MIMPENFVMGLDPKICRTVEAIDPTTYEAALRTTRPFEKPRDEVHQELVVTIGRK